jgi:hypothetical protein
MGGLIGMTMASTENSPIKKLVSVSISLNDFIFLQSSK